MHVIDKYFVSFESMDSGNYLLLFLAAELAVVDNAVVGLVISERTWFLYPSKHFFHHEETDRRRKKEKRKAEKVES
jgi:hypothetical protein